MNLTFQGYLALYGYILFGGLWTIFVLSCLVLAGFYAAKWVQVGMKLITRHFERRMRNGQITKRIKKFKAAVVKNLAFEVRENGKKVAEVGKRSTGLR